LDARLEQLVSLNKQFSDPGPVCDCVVWHDGSVWRASKSCAQTAWTACITIDAWGEVLCSDQSLYVCLCGGVNAVVDTKGEGDLSNAKIMADYAVAREYDTFSKDDLLNYAVKIYNDGNILCIVTDAGARKCSRDYHQLIVHAAPPWHHPNRFLNAPFS